MLRKMMVTGLMAATLLSGIAPAYAQSNAEQRGNRGGERAGRMDGGGSMRGEGAGRMRSGQMPQGMNQPRGDSPSQRWQQRAAERPTPPMAQVRPDATGNPQWRGERNQPSDRQPDNVARDRNAQMQNWRDQRQGDQPRQGGRQDWRSDRQNDQRDRQNDRRDDRQDWRNDRRDDRRDWRDDRQTGQRWNDNRGWAGNGAGGANWNNGRRYDDRTRWTDQRRWDNGWRNDRRYDWNSYRNRYGDRYRVGRYYAPRGWDYGYRRFSVGIFLSNMLYANNYWLDDPYSYRLPPAYGSLRWIRYYDDALLVDIRDGYVVDVINNFFW